VSRPVPLPAGPGQESVWDYPRPPAVEATSELVEIRLDGRCIAQTTQALRVLETSHPPTYYLPVDCFVEGSLVPAAGHSLCEWKGQASYFDLVAGDLRATRSAWHYPDPLPTYAALSGHVAVMPAAVDACLVDGELVRAQEGGFYGGWITDRVVGPFKGVPGSWGW
jgi:uncharacterized protein (DUF427 family)